MSYLYAHLNFQDLTTPEQVVFSNYLNLYQAPDMTRPTFFEFLDVNPLGFSFIKPEFMRENKAKAIWMQTTNWRVHPSPSY